MAEGEGQNVGVAGQGDTGTGASVGEGQNVGATGADAGSTEGGDGTGAGTSASWRDELPDDLKSHDGLKDFEDAGSLAKSFLDLKTQHAELEGKVPKVPETADGYTLEIPQDLPQDQNFISAMKSAAFDASMGQEQFSKLSAKYLEMQQVVINHIQSEMDAGVSALKIEWGSKYDANVELARQAFRKFAVSEDEINHINTTGYGDDPVLIRMFHRISAAVSEDIPPEGDGGGMGIAQTGGKPMLNYPKSFGKKK